MNIQELEYISLEHLAATLRLPKKYLKELAIAGHIPVLHPGGRMRFRVDDVRQALRSLAGNGQGQSAKRGREVPCTAGPK